MASTYTKNIGLEQPGTGEQSGSWGATTNLNFDIIDRAVNGVGTITISGTTHTLTTSDGALSDGGYKVLIIAGTPTGTNTITIDPNNAAKCYLVNNTTSQTVVFTQGSGGNSSIPAGVSQWIYADGAGAGARVYELPSDVIGDTTPQLGGNLDVNGFDIVSVSNGNIDIAPNGTGAVNITGTANVVGDLDVDNVNINGNAITSTNTNGNLSLGANGTGKVVISNLSYPSADGTANQVLTTNGSGVLSFSSSLGTSIQLGNWTINVDGSNNLVFSYNASTVAKIATNGAITSEDDITAFGTV